MKEGRRELSRKHTLIALKIVLPLNRKSNVFHCYSKIGRNAPYPRLNSLMSYGYTNINAKM